MEFFVLRRQVGSMSNSEVPGIRKNILLGACNPSHKCCHIESIISHWDGEATKYFCETEL